MKICLFILSVIFYFFLIHYSTSELLRAIIKESFKANFFSNLNFITNHIRNESDSNIETNAIDRYDEDKKYEKVRRENIIVKSKAFSVKAGGL